MRGLFITFEGPDGAGKTTQIKAVEQALALRNRPCILTREPGGTPLAEELRELVKFHASEEPMYDMTELLLFAAARSQHVNYRIRPALEAGITVLCDRFTDSTLAYQGYGRGLDLTLLRQINACAIGECMPDLTFVLDVPPEVSLARRQNRCASNMEQDRLEQAGEEFFLRVRQGFLQLAQESPERIQLIDGSLEPEKITVQILEKLNEYL